MDNTPDVDMSPRLGEKKPTQVEEANPPVNCGFRAEDETSSQVEDTSPTVAQASPIRRRRLFLFSWDEAEKLATVSMAFLGFLAFGWQVHENFSSKSERVGVETGEPAITPEGGIRLPLHVVNRSDRDIYVRAVTLHTRDSAQVKYLPDSVIKLEAGDIHTFDSKMTVASALQIIRLERVSVEVKTTRKSHGQLVQYTLGAATLNTIAVAAGILPPTLDLDSATAADLRVQMVRACGALEEVSVGGYSEDEYGSPYADTTRLSGSFTTFFCKSKPHNIWIVPPRSLHF